MAERRHRRRPAGVRAALTRPYPRPRGDATGDALFHAACAGAAAVLLVILGGVVASLVVGGWPALHRFGFAFLTGTVWDPVGEVYGAAGAIVGTVATALLALAIALPLAIGIAVFLVEFCPARLARPVGIAVELLAGIPSIVYGMWGLFVLAPWFAAHVQAPLAASAAPGSWLATLTHGVPNGANLFTAAVILAIMILPYMAAVFRELLLTVPRDVREAGYGLGCTPFEVMRRIAIPAVGPGMVGVVMLGLGRALGETMAVTFIIGNAHGLPRSPFDAGSTLASTIANEFAEAGSDLHASALIALGLVLFLLSFAVLATARLLLAGSRR